MPQAVRHGCDALSEVPRLRSEWQGTERSVRKERKRSVKLGPAVLQELEQPAQTVLQERQLASEQEPTDQEQAEKERTAEQEPATAELPAAPPMFR